MSQIETVLVTHRESGDEIRINKADYNTELHVLPGEKKSKRELIENNELDLSTGAGEEIETKGKGKNKK